MEKSRLLTPLILTLPLIFLSGCASKKSPEEVVRSEVKASQVVEQAAAAKKEKQQQSNEAYLALIPEWALEAKAPDAEGIHAVGIGDSDQLHSAVQKSLLRAKFELASAVREEISGSSRQYLNDSNGKTSDDEYRELIDQLVAAVPLSGYRIAKKEVISYEGKFTSFIELSLPYSELRKIVATLNGVDNQKLEQIESSFEELEQRVNERLNRGSTTSQRATTPQASVITSASSSQ